MDFFRIIWPDTPSTRLKYKEQVIYDEKDEPLRMVGVNFDITDLI